MNHMKNSNILGFIFCMLIAITILPGQLNSQDLKGNPSIDEKVKKFLFDHSGQWHDMNIPIADGKLLYDLIIKGNYKSALEIGTSTGHSGIYIAWALSKTGGKLITIDIDEARYKTALDNFKQAGLSDYIDARLSDAHVLVKELKGPFDFVFLDAEKEGQLDYFNKLYPKKLVPGGILAVHNAIRQANSMRDYLEMTHKHPDFDTVTLSVTMDDGFCLSYRHRVS